MYVKHNVHAINYDGRFAQLYHGIKVSQWCHNDVTVLLQWYQGVLTARIRRFHDALFRVQEELFSALEILKVLHNLLEYVTRVLQGCYKGVTRVLQGCCYGVHLCLSEGWWSCREGRGKGEGREGRATERLIPTAMISRFFRVSTPLLVSQCREVLTCVR
jgi:hypothetical protein